MTDSNNENEIDKVKNNEHKQNEIDDEHKQYVRIYSDLIESLSWLFDVNKSTISNTVNTNIALYIKSDKCEICQEQINDPLIASAVNVIVDKVGIQNIYTHIAESVYNSSSYKSLETKISFVKKHVCLCKLTEYHTLFRLLSQQVKHSSDISPENALFRLKHRIAITELVCPVIEARSCHKLSTDSTTLNILSDLLKQCSYSNTTVKRISSAIMANLGKESYSEIVGTLRKKCAEGNSDIGLLETLYVISPFDDNELIDMFSNIIKKHGSTWCIEKPNDDTRRTVSWIVDKINDKARRLDLLKDLLAYINEKTAGEYAPHAVNWFVVDILGKYNSKQEVINLFDYRTYAPTYFNMIHTFTECECVPEAKTQDEFNLRVECCEKVLAYSRIYLENSKPARYVRVICALVTRSEHSQFFLKRELCKIFTSFALTMMNEHSLRKTTVEYCVKIVDWVCEKDESLIEDVLKQYINKKSFVKHRSEFKSYMNNLDKLYLEPIPKKSTPDKTLIGSIDSVGSVDNVNNEDSDKEDDMQNCTCLLCLNETSTRLERCGHIMCKECVHARVVGKNTYVCIQCKLPV